ncbi:hypothetical protein [Dyella caseinilytica]|uniref:Uncharacterized protein n=1 Tax=Dyella caseinilytica TaxID=1849581 RepID=A0ABX7GRW6_9GAMM|nr:hypothetical protein [Dyella caseinilytica]QRN52010.1 hypothetical protein ISN74_10860 [Dyella caseinilytica]GGA04265.1 hypothetical protein GCM10011408_27500 [Dyella caseinilytica]
MDSRITATLFTAALALTTQIAAQQATQPTAWHDGSPTFLAANKPAKAPFPTWYLAAPSANVSGPAPTIAGRPLVDDTAAIPFQADAWRSSRLPNRDSIQLANSFRTEPLTTTLTKRLLYVTTPFWLPHSRPFPNSSNLAANNAPINNSASLTWSAFKE